MSFWLYTRDGSGKWHLWGIDFDLVMVAAVIALSAGLFAPILLCDVLIAAYVTCSLLAGGLVCLILSKASLFRRHIWFSFGPALMSKKYAVLYKFAYGLMCAGILFTLLLSGALWGVQQYLQVD
jgi:hypothetical protein